jgi:hypothetical protein
MSYFYFNNFGINLNNLGREILDACNGAFLQLNNLILFLNLAYWI